MLTFKTERQTKNVDFILIKIPWNKSVHLLKNIGSITMQ